MSDNEKQCSGKYQGIFSIDFSLPLSSKDIDSSIIFSGNILSTDCENRINGEINRILEKISDKKPLEIKELQVYSLYSTINTLSPDQEEQKIKYKVLIKEILDYICPENHLD